MWVLKGVAHHCVVPGKGARQGQGRDQGAQAQGDEHQEGVGGREHWHMWTLPCMQAAPKKKVAAKKTVKKAAPKKQ